MPNYGTPQSGGTVTAIQPGDSLRLFDAEAPVPPQASIAFARGYNPGGGYAPIVFDIQFSAVPTDSLLIEGASEDVDAAYQTLHTSTDKQQDYYADQGLFRFYRARIVSWVGGGTLTVTASR